MMQEEQERLEASLRQILPAAPPPDLVERLRAAPVEAQAISRRATVRTFRWRDVFVGWRGLAVAVPASAVMLIAWLGLRSVAMPDKVKSSDASGIRADAVQVDHSLVASFDTVAQLPDGEPVRFRCREWQDNVVIHDDAHGVVISKSSPRVEVVPLRFETY